jgi:hypothetical protein
MVDIQPEYMRSALVLLEHTAKDWRPVLGMREDWPGHKVMPLVASGEG